MSLFTSEALFFIKVDSAGPRLESIWLAIRLSSYMTETRFQEKICNLDFSTSELLFHIDAKRLHRAFLRLAAFPPLKGTSVMEHLLSVAGEWMFGALGLEPELFPWGSLEPRGAVELPLVLQEQSRVWPARW